VQSRTVSIDDTLLNLQIHDCDTRYLDHFRHKYHPSVQGYVFTFDLARRQTFEKMKRWVESLYRYRDDTNFCVIVTGTKWDTQAQREVAFDEARHYCETLYLTYIETSAKTGRNVELLFKLISAFILREILYL